MNNLFSMCIWSNTTQCKYGLISLKVDGGAILEKRKITNQHSEQMPEGRVINATKSASDSFNYCKDMLAVKSVE